MFYKTILYSKVIVKSVIDPYDRNINPIIMNNSPSDIL